MLSSIHPLGERARNNRWRTTISAFAFGAVAAGVLIGGSLGALGARWSDGGWALPAFGVGAVLAGSLDLAGVRAAGPRRQVNERWIGTLRGWVYGGGFGFQLGTGLATFVVTWAVWMTLVAEFLSGSATGGATIGAIFGFGRALAPLAAGTIDRPSRLIRFSARMAAMARPSHLTAGVLTVTIGLLAVMIGV